MEIIETIKTLSFEEPQIILLSIPLILIIYFYLFHKKDIKTSEQVRERRNYLIIRSIIVFLVFAAMASPFVMVKESSTGSAVTILLDKSASMNLYENEDFEQEVSEFYKDLKNTHEFVIINNFSAGNRTAVGDALYLASLNPVKNNIIILASDGSSNYGKDMKKTASNIDARVFSLVPKSPESDISVAIECDDYALIGIKQEIDVIVRKTGDENIKYYLNLKIGSETITKEITQNTSVKIISFNHTYEKEGEYEIAAEVIPESSDFFEINNKFIKNINVFLGPKILLVSKNENENSKLSEILSAYQTTQTTTTDTIKNQNLDKYDAVILNDIPASDLENNYKILHNYISDGHGLLVVGGNNSYDNGNYNNSNFEKILPVISMPQEERGTEVRIMLLIDISGSFVEKGKTVSKIEDAKIKAASIVEALDEDDHLGVVAFDDSTYVIQHLVGGEFKYFSGKLPKNELKDKILSFSTTPTQGTIMSKALRDAQIELGDEGGYVILLSDGRLNFAWDEKRSKEIAETMSEKGITILTVGIGERLNTGFLKELSQLTNGTYYKPEELAGLKLDIKEIKNKTSSGSVKISDYNHFITRNSELIAVIDDFNRVSGKKDAQVLVTKEGELILGVWRYGLGRVASLAADDGQDWAERIYESNIIYRTINWAAGGIEEKNYTNIQNYPAEYMNLGVDENALRDISKIYKISQTNELKNEINKYINEQKTEVTKKEHIWQYFVIIALLLFFADVCYRRIKEIIKLRSK